MHVRLRAAGQRREADGTVSRELKVPSLHSSTPPCVVQEPFSSLSFFGTLSLYCRLELSFFRLELSLSLCLGLSLSLFGLSLSLSVWNSLSLFGCSSLSFFGTFSELIPAARKIEFESCKQLKKAVRF